MLIKSAILACAIQGVPSTIVNALIENESRWKPWTISVNYPKKNKTIAEYVYKKWADGEIGSKQAALDLANYALSYSDNISLSVGLMQISTINFKQYGLTLEKALDPCTNIEVGSHIYLSNYWQAYQEVPQKFYATLSAASLYNSGNDRIGWSNGYVKRFVSQLPEGTIRAMPDLRTLDNGLAASASADSVNPAEQAPSTVVAGFEQDNKADADVKAIAVSKDQQKQAPTNGSVQGQTQIKLDFDQSNIDEGDTAINVEHLYEALDDEAQNKTPESSSLVK